MLLSCVKQKTWQFLIKLCIGIWYTRAAFGTMFYYLDRVISLIVACEILMLVQCWLLFSYL